MKKKIAQRALIGAPCGLLICTVITVIISLSAGGGDYRPVDPQLIEDCGNEINAFIIQSLLCMFYGSLCAASSVIWEVEKWSPLRQTVVHFVTLTAGTLPIAYFMRWMERSIPGYLSYIAIFAATYILIWISMYFSMKAKLKKLNCAVNQNEQ